MSSYSDFANAVSRLELERANALAEGQRENGRIWGSTLANLGQVIGNQIQTYPLQQAAIAEAKQRQQMGQLQIEEIQRQRQAQTLLDNAYQQYGGDIGKLTSALAESGQGHLIPTVMESHAKYQKALADAAEASDKVEASHANIAAQVGAEMQAQLDAGGPNAVKNAAGWGISRFADLQKRGILPDATAQGLTAQINPADETSVRGVAQRLVNAPKLLGKNIPLKNDERLVSPTGQTVIPAMSGGAKTEAELAADAANPQSPTAGQSKAALDLLRQGKAETGAQDDQRYETIVANRAMKKPVSPEDAAFVTAYERRKLLGPEASAAAAADRQASTQAAANARLDRQENFTEQQAGRKELQEKIEQPYLDAREKADTIRSVVAAAKNGNMEAAGVQSLLATLGLTTAEGVKRINSTELQNVQGAGSLFERLKGAVGKVKAGQPLSPKLQDDLIDLAGLLEQSAYKKYQAGFGTTTKRYKLTDEQPQPAPPSGAPSPSGVKVLSIVPVK